MDVFEKQGLVACLSGIKIVEKEAKEKLSHGFFTLDHDVKGGETFDIQHGLGKVPEFFYLRIVGDASLLNADVAILWTSKTFASSAVTSLRQVGFSTTVASGGIVRVSGLMTTNEKYFAVGDDEKMTLTPDSTSRFWAAGEYEFWAF